MKHIVEFMDIYTLEERNAKENVRNYLEKQGMQNISIGGATPGQKDDKFYRVHYSCSQPQMQDLENLNPEYYAFVKMYPYLYKFEFSFYDRFSIIGLSDPDLSQDFLYKYEYPTLGRLTLDFENNCMLLDLSEMNNDLFEDFINKVNADIINPILPQLDFINIVKSKYQQGEFNIKIDSIAKGTIMEAYKLSLETCNVAYNYQCEFIHSEKKKQNDSTTLKLKFETPNK